MKQVIAMHGWAGDHRIWAPWARQFQAQNWHWQSGERGYGHLTPRCPDWLTNPDDAPHRRVVIGHSLGPHLLGEHHLKQATDVVFLASFSRFVPEGRAGRALHTGLKGMGRSIGSDGEDSMLHTFLARAAAPAAADGLPASPARDGLSSPGREQLRGDLTRLIECTSLPAGLPQHARVLVVEAGSDAIVVPEARRQLIDDLAAHLDQPPEVWTLQDSGHALLVPDLLLRVQAWLDDVPFSSP